MLGKYSLSETKHFMLLCLGVAIIQGGYYLLPWLWKKTKRKKPVVVSDSRAEEINVALFFPESRLPCKYLYKLGRCNRVNCEFSHNAQVLTCLMDNLNAAKRSLDICVYMLTSHELCSVIKAIYNRGVHVRIITDGTFGDEDRTRIRELRAEGIAVRCNLPANRLLMHHKFAIVDGNILLNGSFNWTWQAIVGNHENILITSNKDLLLSYVNEFNRLWNLFNPTKQTAQLLFHPV